MLVHDDSAPLVHLHPSRGQVQSCGIGAASGSQKNGIRIQPQHLARHGIPADNRRTVHGLHTGIQTERYAFLLQHLLHTGGNVTVFAGYQFGRAFQHRHLRTERSVHRGELQADVSAAHDDETLGQLRQFHDGSAGVHLRIVLYPLDRRNDGFGSRIDKYPRRLKPDRFFRHAYLHRIGGDERARTRIYRYIGMVCQIAVVLLTQERGHFLFLCHGAAVVRLFLFPGRALIRQLRRMYQCLGRNTSDIDTRTAVHLIRTFYHGNSKVPFRQLGSECLAAFSKADNNSIILFHTLISLIDSILFSRCPPAPRRLRQGWRYL